MKSQTGNAPHSAPAEARRRDEKAIAVQKSTTLAELLRWPVASPHATC
jgi:hypothetical protein